jgi:hypothetical protein
MTYTPSASPLSGTSDFGHPITLSYTPAVAETPLAAETPEAREQRALREQMGQSRVYAMNLLAEVSPHYGKVPTRAQRRAQRDSKPVNVFAVAAAVTSRFTDKPTLDAAIERK